jgi:hypothetical protein
LLKIERINYSAHRVQSAKFEAETMATELMRFGKLSVDIVSLTQAPDAKAFRDELSLIFAAAKWTQTRGVIGSTDRAIFNVLIELGSDSSPNAKNAGQYLADHLNSLGIAATFTNEQRPPFTGVGGLNGAASLSITIGPRS